MIAGRAATMPRLTSAIMFVVCAAFAAAIVGVLVLVATYLVSIGASSLTWSFFTEVPTGDVANPGGMRHAIEGTAILVALAAMVGVPVGVLTGIHLSAYGAGGRR